MNNIELIKILKIEGYKNIVEVKGKGLCGVFQFIYTTGLCVGLDESGYEYRYCYPNEKTFYALLALKIWENSKTDVEGDPEDSYWIKRKGAGSEYSNPKRI